jgi:hypothetical protein
MLPLESKDLLLVRVWHRDRAHRMALHDRSWLFMTTLMGQSCVASVAQALPYCCFVGVFPLSLPA